MRQIHNHSHLFWSFLCSGLFTIVAILLFLSRMSATAAGIHHQANNASFRNTVAVSQPYLVKDIYTGSASSEPMFLSSLEDVVLFSADNGVDGAELWKSDGESAGTNLIKDLHPGPDGSDPSFLYNFNGVDFFAARDSFAFFKNLWMSDGSVTGTVPILAFYIPSCSCFSSALWEPFGFTAVGDTLFFGGMDVYHDQALFITDGILTDTLVVKYFDSLYGMINLNDRVYFSAREMSNDYDKLWTSDGTLTGTHIVRDINPDGNAYVEQFTVYHNQLFFIATDSASGTELWKSNGTSEGTVMVKDINPGSDSSSPFGLVVVDDKLFFSAFQEDTGVELWKTDGTPDGTVLVKDIFTGTESSYARSLIALNGELLFVATDSRGKELWISDGTPAGTNLLKDINPGDASSNPGGFNPEENFFRYGNLVYFYADDGSHGNELWHSNGTPDGTVMVDDINPGPGGSEPSNFAALNGLLLFSADDGEHGRELWAMLLPQIYPVYLPLLNR